MAVRGSATALPFPDASFDSVISSECIEHTPDPVAAVAEMLRVLKPGGHLFLTTPNLVWRWSVTLAELLGMRRFEGIENWLSRTTLKKAIVRTGAVVELSEGLHVMPFQLRPLWPVIGWMNEHCQFLRMVMINQCWIARK
jgi:2-polyprenyl-6-hydroxyphenyl methylase/3-demethylubiquinone-9 3-methyltransferase